MPVLGLALRAFATGAAVLAALAIVWQVGILFLLVTTGGPGVRLANALSALPVLGGLVPSRIAPLAAGLLAAPFVIARMRRLIRLGRRRAAALVGSSAVTVVLVAFSYRFPALVLSAAFAWSVRDRECASHPRLSSWILLAAAAAAARAPIDVSLRVRPHGLQFARATSGTLVMTPEELDATGDSVVVGGCNSLYDEPRWVWVW